MTCTLTPVSHLYTVPRGHSFSLRVRVCSPPEANKKAKHDRPANCRTSACIAQKVPMKKKGPSGDAGGSGTAKQSFYASKQKPRKSKGKGKIDVGPHVEEHVPDENIYTLGTDARS